MNLSTKNKLLLIIAVSFAVRLILLWMVAGSGSFETWEYEDIARNLVKGVGFRNLYMGTTYYSCTTPLYPFLCAGVYSLFGVNHAIVAFIQITVSSLLCAVIFDIARRIFSDDNVALLSALLCALHPGLIWYSVIKIHPLTFDVFFLSASLWSFLYLRESLVFARSFLAGIITGVCVYTRSTVVAFFPIAVMWLAANFRGGIKKVAANTAVIVLAMSLVVLPWVIRNYIVHKEIMLTTSTDAEVLWRGNNINTTGSSYTADGKIMMWTDRAFFEKVSSLPELDQRKLFREEALRFIREHPARFVGLFFKKLYYFWWFSPSSGLLYPRPYLAVYKILYSAVLVCFGIGVFGVARGTVPADKPNFALALLSLLAISVFQSLFYVEGRHRWGVEPVFLIIASAGAINALRLFNVRRGRRCA